MFRVLFLNQIFLYSETPQTVKSAGFVVVIVILKE